MTRYLPTALCVLIVPCVLAGAAMAQCWPEPCEGFSWVGASPKNNDVPPVHQYVFCFTIINPETCQPVAGFPASLVALDFERCHEPTTRPQTEIPANTDSDLEGNVFWHGNLSFGGADPCAVGVLIQGLLFYLIDPHAPGGVRSPDVNGDGLIALGDLMQWQQAFVSAAPPYVGDLGPVFDDVIALEDLLTWQVHYTAP